ncbi:hypothetical protein LTR85_000679 [Meristemomyces frigidus]|nr:hypothetical protein LTR85_000679 [Meristemomyces frigidus]
MASLFRPRPRTLCNSHRAFSTTTPRAVSLQWEKNDADAIADTVPTYPHGPTRWYKQSRLGLYGGQRIRFGNNVGEKIEVKTRRNWKVNVLTRKLFSKSLDRHVQVRVSTRVLRTIDKLGGLDEYLLGEKEGRVRELGESGWWLRWAIMQTPGIKARFAEERRRLGIPEEVLERETVELAEAQAVIEEASDAEAEAAEELGEAVATDDAFVVEQAPGLPALKFRVGPNKHIVLTAEGWRRTRPSTNHAVETAQAKLRRILENETLPRREAEFRAELAQQQAELEPTERLTRKEVEEELKVAKRGWRAECARLVEERYEAHVAGREARKAARKEVKRVERLAERERRVLEVAE